MQRVARSWMLFVVTLGVLAMLAPTVARAQANGERPFELMVGDDAPKLAIAHWIKGEPIQQFEKGKIYVVEFWAIWCGPCIVNIPHLNEIQQTYKDRGLTVVSVTSPDPRNTLDAVKRFVADPEREMNYVVAFDTDDRTMDKTWMEAAGQMSIPSALVVDRNGKIAWIGHPYFIDDDLKEIVEGTYDLEAATLAYAKKAKEEAAAVREQQRLMRERAQAASVMEKVGEIAMQLAQKKYDEASTAGRALMEGEAKDVPQALSAIAWIIVDPQQPHETRDLELAYAAATRAVELNEWKDADSIDTLAWCYYHKGEHAKAVEVETKALEVANDQIRPFIEGSMKTFRAALEESE